MSGQWTVGVVDRHGLGKETEVELTLAVEERLINFRAYCGNPLACALVIEEVEKALPGIKAEVEPPAGPASIGERAKAFVEADIAKSEAEWCRDEAEECLIKSMEADGIESLIIDEHMIWLEMADGKPWLSRDGAPLRVE